MAANKNALLRYLIIDKALRQVRQCTLNNILDICNKNLPYSVSARAIQLDIEHLRYCKELQLFAPIIFVRGKPGYYKYSDSGYTIFFALQDINFEL